MQIQSIDEVNNAMRGNRLRNFPSHKHGHDRLVPFPRPATTLSRPLCSAPSFFVAGNCFARGMEKALRASDMQVLSSVFSSDLPGDAVKQFQNFNAFNIDVLSNEIAWSTGQADAMSESLIQVGDEWVDMQIHFTVAGPREEMLKRRAAFNALYAPVSQADVVIMTVGGRRYWYDAENQLYLNAMPTRKMTQLYPGRFELHSMDLEAAEKRIERAISLVENANPNAHIMLVNSPVYQPSSFSSVDALVDQTVGKSLQRVAIDNVIARNPNVDYLPAYEVVTFSDLEHAFIPNSLNHTQPDVAARIAADMLEAGGITDVRYERVAASGYGQALLRSRDFEATERLLAPILCDENGDVRHDNLQMSWIHRDFILALQSQKRRQEGLSHGISVLRAIDEAREAEAREGGQPDASEGILSKCKNGQPMVMMRTLSHLVRALGDKEQCALFNRYVAEFELKIDPIEAGSHARGLDLRAEVAAIQTAYRERRDEDVLSLVKASDDIRRDLTEQERRITDTTNLQAAARLNRGGEAIDRALSLIDAEGAEGMNARVLANICRSQADMKQLEHLLTCVPESFLSDDQRNQLQERLAFFQKRHAAST